jgi:uncharacterized oxidoreductase
MIISGNTILITGGATGIGLALAEKFIENNNEVIVCGRREEKLREAKEKYPQIHIRICDVSTRSERVKLFDWIKENFSRLNVLINNAGIQRPVDFKKGKTDYKKAHEEIMINFDAIVHLSMLFIPHLMEQKESVIVNVSSGLGFIPIALMPVYCATKAAIHSLSMTMRHQLKNSQIKVIELIPPTVDTDLDKGERDKRGMKNKGITPEEFATEAFEKLKTGIYEITVGHSSNLFEAARTNFDEVFKRMNG